MEILKIRSGHGLTTTILGQRPTGDFTYQINTRLFQSAHREWQRNAEKQASPMGVMTLDFERIWITREEVEQVAAAIHSTSSPVTLV